MGVGRRLKEYNRDIKIIGIQPSRSGHRQEGLLNLEEFYPEIFDSNELDDVIMVDDDDAYKTAREIFLKEGLFVGISSGATMYGAINLSKQLKKGFIVTIFGDHGFKYLSTKIFNI